MNEQRTRTESSPGRLVFATGFAALTTAALLAVHITTSSSVDDTVTPDDDAHAGQRTTSGRNGVAVAAASSTPSTKDRDAGNVVLRGRAHASRQRGMTPRGGAGDMRDRPLGLEVARDHPRRPELAARADRVAAHARLRLDALDRKLDLTPAQRAKLFSMLVRSSENYDPAMRVSDSGVSQPIAEADPAAGISELLEPSQTETLIEHTLADRALWREIFDNLRIQLDQNTPVVPAYADEIADPPASAPQRGNIYDFPQPAD